MSTIVKRKIAAFYRQTNDPRYLWNRTVKEQPVPRIENGIKIYPVMFAEGFFESQIDWVQGA